MVLSVYDIEGKEIDKVALDERVFDGSVNEPVLYQAVVNYRSNQRQGTASTKTRGEVSGGGKKPWRQKGTGRARAGSIRSPLWRHGGVVFGPHPRDFGYLLPKQVKRKALLSSLNAKIRDKEIKIVNEIRIDPPKTKMLLAMLKKLNMAKSTLLVVAETDKNLKLAFRNVDGLSLMRYCDLNAYEILSHKNVLLTKKAMEQLAAAFTKS